MGKVEDIKRQIDDTHQDLSGLDVYKKEKLFKAGIDMMYAQVMDIIRCVEKQEEMEERQ